ncbi:hypothetical protein THOE12_10030 [Vibrio rotiferianus]|nr:hypothetical protein THOE12_10030 [Vibrio rotiferianus]
MQLVFSDINPISIQSITYSSLVCDLHSITIAYKDTSLFNYALTHALQWLKFLHSHIFLIFQT